MTVAVNVIVSPKIGAVAGAVIAIEGVARPTTTSRGGVEVRAEKFESPLKVAWTVYVPETGVAIVQVKVSVRAPTFWTPAL